jgi:beta-glucanase (GH16 family)
LVVTAAMNADTRSAVGHMQSRSQITRNNFSRRLAAIAGVVTIVGVGILVVPAKSTASSQITVDAYVSTHETSPAGSITSPAFSTSQPNELVVAYLTSDGPNRSGGQTFSSVTGGGLTWTLRQRTNAQAGDAEIWQAAATTTLSNVTVKATRSGGSFDGTLDVVSYIGASTATSGATAGQSAAGGAPSVSLTTSAANSWVWAVGDDWDNAVPRTLGPSQTLLDQYLASGVGDTYWVQYASGQSQPAGTRVTLNDTAPTSDRWDLAAIEIVPGQPPTPPPTVPASLTAKAVSASQVNLSWSASSDPAGVAGYSVYRNGVLLSTSPTTSYTDSTVHPGSPYSYTVSAYDASGNASAQSAPATVTTPPVYVAPVLSLTGTPASLSNDPTATVTFSATNTSDPTGSLGYDCSLNGAAPTSCTSPEAYSSLADGQYSFAVTATDTSDGLTSSPQSSSWTIDTVPPSVSIMTPGSNSTLSGSVPISAQASDKVAVASVQFELDGVDLGSAVTSSPYTYTWNTAAASNGMHTITAVATDTAGNTATASVTVDLANTISVPVELTEPVVTGTVATGDVLTTSNGTWTNSPTGYAYQWEQCSTSGTGCTNINLATNATYTVAAGDAGHTLTAIVTASNGAGPASATAPAVPLVDEFNGTNVDTNVWTVLDQQGDTSNDEQECYLPGQVTEAGGFLAETAAYVSGGFTCPAGTPSYPVCTGACAAPTKYYESGDVTMKSVNFTYGTVVFRAEFPGSPHTTWPAIWLLGAACQQPTYLTVNGLDGGYNCPWNYDAEDAAEIDIAEGNTGSTTSMYENVYNSSGNVNRACTTPLTDYSTNFHTYELDWEPGSLVFKVDGTVTRCGLTGSGVPSHPMFLIINNAIQRGSPVASTLPQTMTVDYVHISH